MFKRKDGLWQERIKIDGKDKYFYGKTKKDLLAKIAEHQQQADRSRKLSEVLDDWVAYKQEFVTEKTIEGYRAPIKRLKNTFGDMYPEEVTPYQVQAFVNELAAQKYKRSTVQRPLDVLRMVFDYIITRPGSKLTANPCSAVALPRGLTQEVRDLASREDIEKVKAGVHLEFGLFAYMMMYTGLRDGELLAVTSDSIKGNIIEIKTGLTWENGNRPVISPPKTDAGIRTVVILEPLRKVLPKFSGFLFSADGGKSPLTKQQFRRRWQKYCREAGLADPEYITHESPGKNKRIYTKTIWHYRIVPYQLRHEYATLCYDAGMDMKDTQHLMGHASEETTRRIYTHITNLRRQNSVQKLEEYLKGVEKM